AAAETVVPAPSADRVVDGAALDHVGRRVAGQRVGLAGPGEVLEPGERVRAGARGGAGGEVRRDRDVRRGEARGVSAVPAGEGVVAAAPVDHVVAVAAVDHVRVAVAGQVIAARAAGQVLDRGDRVVAGRAGGGSGREARPHAARDARVRDGVDAVATGERVVAEPAVQDVVPRPANERVGVAVSGQRVVACPAGDVLDGGDRVVARGGRVLGPARRQVHRDRAGRGGVARGVDAVPAGERVVAQAAGQRVVSVAAVQDVVRAVAGQRVVTAAAGEVLDVRERVGAGASGDRGGRGGDGVGRAGVVGGVGAVAAVHGVVAEAGPDD